MSFKTGIKKNKTIINVIINIITYLDFNKL